VKIDDVVGAMVRMRRWLIPLWHAVLESTRD
jgi:hypothetical protein